jgi:transporter family protein
MIVSWQWYALGSAFFAGLTAVLAKTGVQGMPSNTATLIRTVVIGIFLTIVVSVRQEWLDPAVLTKKSIVFLVLSGLATGLSWMLYFRALQLGNVSMVSSVDKLSLPFAVILSIIFLSEHVGVQQWAGIALVTAGTFLIAVK